MIEACKKCRTRVYIGIGHTCPDTACYYHVPVAQPSPSRAQGHAMSSVAAGGVVWRCFHCDDEFTDRELAALHFGRNLMHEPACTIDVAEYRRMEAECESYREEDAAIHREMHRMASEHRTALQRAEEDGYAKGLGDYQACEDKLTAAQP